MKVLSQSQVLLLHKQLIKRYGGSEGLRDSGLLDAALNGPFQTFDNAELYPSLLEKAARLAYSLVCDHPFIDGNKRIGAHAMLVFLAINGVQLTYMDQEMIDLFLNLAAGKISSEDLLHWLQTHVV